MLGRERKETALCLIKWASKEKNGSAIFFFVYGQYHSGKRAEGISLSFQTFCSKVGSGLQNALAMSLLAGFGFVSGEPLQTAGTENGIWLLYTLVPCIGYALALLLLRGYRLRDRYVQLMQTANMGEISYEEAAQKLQEMGFVP